MRPGKAASLLSAATAALMLLASSSAFEGPRHLSCPHSIVPEVPVTCYATGNVVAGANVTYTFPIATASEPFDLVITLHTQTGDADLLVDVPNGRQLVSRHGSGEDVVFLPRDKVAAGDYVVTVEGAGDQSSYKLLVEKHNKQRTLAAADRAALQQASILDSPCCSRPGSCTSLRTGLLVTLSAPALAPDAAVGTSAAAGGAAPTAGADVTAGSAQEWGVSGSSSSRDLCNTGQNLCDPEGRLLHLALVNEYLSCRFPTEALAALSSLTLLDLTMNDLTGTLEGDVVPAVQRLPALENLLLSHNRLEGSLLCDLATPSLAELGLAANQLKGSIPACLVQSPALQELYLAGNDLEGSLPQPPLESKLLIISAYGMRLNGSIPDLSALPQLQALQLQSNQLSGGLPAMPPTMRYLDLEYNGLSGTIPSQWGQLAELEVLRMRHNVLTGSLPAELAQRDILEQLLLSHNQFNGSLPSAWLAPELSTLALQYNQFTGPLPGALALLPNLAVLQLTGNRLGGTLESFALALAAAPIPSRLQLLDLSSNQLSGPVPQELQGLSLFADGGNSFVMVDGISVPESFDLADNEFSGTFPGWLPQAMVDSRAVISLEDNRLSCPAGPISVSESLPYNRMLGLECIAQDGSVQPVSDMLLTRPVPHFDVAVPTLAPAAVPAAAAAAVPTPAGAADAAPAAVAPAPAAVPAAAAVAAAAPGPSRPDMSPRNGRGGGDSAAAAAEQSQTSGGSEAAAARAGKGPSSSGGGGAASEPAAPAAAASSGGAVAGDGSYAVADDGSSSGSTGSGTGSSTSSTSSGTGSGGTPGWALALVVLGSLGAAALVARLAGPWIRHRLRLSSSNRYETYRPEAPTAAAAAAQAVLAKRQAIALAELSSSVSRKVADGTGGLPGAWGLGGGGGAAGASSTPCTSSAAGAAEAFQIGTAVHSAHPPEHSPV
ncbi:hypothetical protein D9Q98_010296 [Chlorella vulgaris]|uniref:Uncharacterized protein n=1 Tax=Chlorella vulgaris TaxID=3077 RepID=A0A9D4TJU7_CHLVU|nr:hypothetical protein D9Q98_010296 [Chlorella vulgaris]